MRLEMHLIKCADVSPEKDGYYAVVELRKGKVYDVRAIEYTTDGGWNTFRRLCGGLCDENRIRFEDPEKYPEAYWCDASVLTEDDDE